VPVVVYFLVMAFVALAATIAARETRHATI